MHRPVAISFLFYLHAGNTELYEEKQLRTKCFAIAAMLWKHLI